MQGSQFRHIDTGGAGNTASFPPLDAHQPIANNTMSRGGQPSTSPDRNSSPPAGAVAAPASAAASQTRPRESIPTACLACVRTTQSITH